MNVKMSDVRRPVEYTNIYGSFAIRQTEIRHRPYVLVGTDKKWGGEIQHGVMVYTLFIPVDSCTVQGLTLVNFFHKFVTEINWGWGPGRQVQQLQGKNTTTTKTLAEFGNSDKALSTFMSAMNTCTQERDINKVSKRR